MSKATTRFPILVRQLWQEWGFLLSTYRWLGFGDLRLQLPLKNRAADMKRRLWLCAVVGAIFGGAAVQSVHLIRERRGDELFKQRIRCKAFADKYLKENVTELKSIYVMRIEFSRSRSSCIVETMEHFSTKPLQEGLTQRGLGDPGSLESDTLKIVDLLTGEDIFDRICTGKGECGQMMRKQEEEFDRAR